MIAECAPRLVSSHFHIIKAFRKIGRSKTIVEVIRFVLVTIHKKRGMFFFPLLLNEMLVITTANTEFLQMRYNVRMIAGAFWFVPDGIAVEIACKHNMICS